MIEGVDRCLSGFSDCPFANIDETLQTSRLLLSQVHLSWEDRRKVKYFAIILYIIQRLLLFGSHIDTSKKG